MTEMLLSLVILALLLAAVATAVKGTLGSYVENGEIAATTQAARVVFNALMGQVRLAESVDSAQPVSSWIEITPPDNPEELTLIRYDLTDGVLYCRQTVKGVETPVPLISSSETVKVLDFKITRQTALDEHGASYTVQVNASLSLQAGGNPFYVSAATCPRRNLMY